MFDDSVRGLSGQILTVIHTFSNDGTRNLLDIFDLRDNVAPVLVTYDDKIIEGSDEIISYLKINGLAK